MHLERFVIVVAGGSGLRMGTSVPKQFLLLNGQPLLMHTLESFFRAIEDIQILLVLPAAHIPYWKELRIQYGFNIPHRIAEGGESRGESVKNGLNMISAESGLVAVHDGVRPLLDDELIRRVYSQAEKKGSAIPCVPVSDSLRQLTQEGSKPVCRADMVAIQTPQCFRLEMLRKAYDQQNYTNFTDDAQHVEAIGERVYLSKGSFENLKITTAVDLLLAEAILKSHLQR